MKVLRNLSSHDFMHVHGDEILVLPANGVKEVPDEVAKIWLKLPEITLDSDPAKDEEIERLRAENEALKAAQEREALLKRAKELGIEGVYAPQTKIETIKKKIAEAEAKLTAKEEEPKNEEKAPENDGAQEGSN